MNDEAMQATLDRMRSAVMADPLSPRSVIFQAALSGIATSFVGAGCKRISPMPSPHAIAVLLDDEAEGPSGYSDQDGLRALLASAVHMEVWHDESGTDTTAAVHFVRKAANGIAVVAVTTSDRAAEWERLLSQFRPHTTRQ